ncbi:MAG: PocR ligand-binding domain-containing protein [Clostridia bacterium]|nr:PocR ligand-binding domain-containing protein [Clostridia bacterium]MBQ6721288.1 PocR ligand-binding domain-containing protein [Clostridia bacterium]
MLSSFDFTKLNALLKDFYNLTRMRITVYDHTCREIASFPSRVAPVCQFIRSDPKADTACRACDSRACQQARKQRKAFIYRCHVGLTEAIAPVILENEVIAFLSFGHQFAFRDQEEGRREIIARCAGFDLDHTALCNLISEMHVVDETYILSGVHIMEAVASYLCMERMISLQTYSLQAEIDAFITQHFTEDISVETLCRHFAISRTALYEFARQNYGTGIAQHIRDMRIRYAQNLLAADPDLSISRIAEKCGFRDYNYFITVFSRETGVPPRKYRMNRKTSEA